MTFLISVYSDARSAFQESLVRLHYHWAIQRPKKNCSGIGFPLTLTTSKRIQFQPNIPATFALSFHSILPTTSTSYIVQLLMLFQQFFLVVFLFFVILLYNSAEPYYFTINYDYKRSISSRYYFYFHDCIGIAYLNKAERIDRIEWLLN